LASLADDLRKDDSPAEVKNASPGDATLSFQAPPSEYRYEFRPPPTIEGFACTKKRFSSKPDVAEVLDVLRQR
jgi:hypothetical protein